MKKFKYLKISKTKKLRFIDNYFKKNLYIVFLHGFMSDIEGKKPQTLLRFAKKKKLGFLALEYSGHGKSSGEFTKGNISSWTKDATVVITNPTHFAVAIKDPNLRDLEENLQDKTGIYSMKDVLADLFKN